MRETVFGSVVGCIWKSEIECVIHLVTYVARWRWNPDYDGTFHSGNDPVATPAAVGPTGGWTFTRPNTWTLQVAPSPCLLATGELKPVLPVWSAEDSLLGSHAACQSSLRKHPVDCWIVTSTLSVSRTFERVNEYRCDEYLIIIHHNSRGRHQCGVSSIRPSSLHGLKNLFTVVNEHFLIGDVTLWEYSFMPNSIIRSALPMDL